jgi:hypothetical protein
VTPPVWRDVVKVGAIDFVVTAAFPRLPSWLRWPIGLGPRGLVAYVGVNTLVMFWIRAWVIPRFKRMAEERERAKQELRDQLGREPTEDELFAHLGIACER